LLANAGDLCNRLLSESGIFRLDQRGNDDPLPPSVETTSWPEGVQGRKFAPGTPPFNCSRPWSRCGAEFDEPPAQGTWNHAKMRTMAEPRTTVGG
jgi:hypothetical protein